jgi:hypothetical protein
LLLVGGPIVVVGCDFVVDVSRMGFKGYDVVVDISIERDLREIAGTRSKQDQIVLWTQKWPCGPASTRLKI